jgi:hypothetical protein
MVRARVFSPEINALVAAPPDADLMIAAHQRSAQRLQIVYPAELDNLKEYLGEEYVPLVDEYGRHARGGGGAAVKAGEGRRALVIKRVVVDAKTLERDDVAGVIVSQSKALSVSTGSMYLVEEVSGAGADRARYALAYDPAAFSDPARARACRTGTGSKVVAGAYRAVALSDGMPGEYVSLVLFKLEKAEAGCREREPIVVYHGRTYVRAPLFEAVRRHAFANEVSLSFCLSLFVAAITTASRPRRPRSSAPS